MSFNLSHSDGLAVCAVAREGQLGVDVERVRRIVDADAIVTRFFAAGEARRYAALAPADRDAAFFSAWTRKEAFVKAIGDGLQCPLGSFEVDISPAAAWSPGLSCRTAGPWQLRSFEPAAGYTGAVACDRPIRALERFTFGDRPHTAASGPVSLAGMMAVDLNADLGESFGPWTLGSDAAVLASITSANVACGFHAGDPGIMRQTVRAARAAGVAVGAHPGFPDLAGFGRRQLAASPREVEDFVLYQIGALAAIAAAEGVGLQHVKPHGALYNMAVRDRALADAVARAAASFDSSLVLFGPPGSELVRAGESAGLAVAAEGFADRAYEPDGTLAPRTRAGAVLHDPDIVVARAVRMAREGVVLAADGTDIPLRVATICVHGDTPGAAELTRLIRAALTAAGIPVRAVRGAAGAGE